MGKCINHGGLLYLGYDIKVGIQSNLNEYREIYMYQRTRSEIFMRQGDSDL